MGLLHASRVQRKVRYFIHKAYSLRDIELDCESTELLTSLIPKIVVRVFKNLG